MIGLLIAAFEHVAGRAKGPVEKSEEETKGEKEVEMNAKGNVKGEANELSEKMKD